MITENPNFICMFIRTNEPLASLACLLDNSAFKHLTPKPPNMAATKVLPLWHTTHFTIFFLATLLWHTKVTCWWEEEEYETNCLFSTSPNSAWPDPVRFCSFSITSRDCREPVLSSLLAYWSIAYWSICTCTELHLHFHLQVQIPPHPKGQDVLPSAAPVWKKNTWITKFKKCRVCLYDVLITYLKRSMPLRTIKELGQWSISWKYRHSLQCGCGQYFYFLLHKRMRAKSKVQTASWTDKTALCCIQNFGSFQASAQTSC